MQRVLRMVSLLAILHRLALLTAPVLGYLYNDYLVLVVEGIVLPRVATGSTSTAAMKMEHGSLNIRNNVLYKIL